MKNIVIILFLLLTTWAGHAQTIAELVTDCSKEADSLKRLVCYDRLAEKIAEIPAATKMNPAPTPLKEISVAATVVTPAAEKAADASPSIHAEQGETNSAKIEQFGMEHKAAQQNTEDKIYALVSSVTYDHNKKLLIRLDNGHSWKQTDSGTVGLDVGERIYIERGALGSFFMSKDDINRRVRVKRTK